MSAVSPNFVQSPRAAVVHICFSLINLSSGGEKGSKVLIFGANFNGGATNGEI